MMREQRKPDPGPACPTRRSGERLDAWLRGHLEIDEKGAWVARHDTAAEVAPKQRTDLGLEVLRENGGRAHIFVRRVVDGAGIDERSTNPGHDVFDSPTAAEVGLFALVVAVHHVGEHVTQAGLRMVGHERTRYLVVAAAAHSPRFTARLHPRAEQAAAELDDTITYLESGR